MNKKKKTADALTILHRRYYAGQPERLAALEEARANDSVARKITALREKAGLSQRQLAKLIGTTARSSADWKTPSMKATRWRCSIALPPHSISGWKCVRSLAG